MFSDNRLFIIIHNIDGNCLRDTSIQYCLSELASNKYVHILASVDHINSSICKMFTALFNHPTIKWDSKINFS